MKLRLLSAWLAFFETTAGAQIQADLKLNRFQYIAYEPVIVTISITNLAGRDVDLRDSAGQAWFGFEVTANDGEPIAPLPLAAAAASINPGRKGKPAAPSAATDGGKREYLGYIVRVFYHEHLQAEKADPKRLLQLFPVSPGTSQ